MGKQRQTYQRWGCINNDAPICDGEKCCHDPTIRHRMNSSNGSKISVAARSEPEDEIKELVIVGAGPHALALLLRLLEPDADFLSDKERHLLAENRVRMRAMKSDRDVIQHIEKLSRGPRATLRPQAKKHHKSRRKLDSNACNNSLRDEIPPPLSLEEVLKSVTVVDKCGGWMSSWKENFATIGIQRLRSLMNAHLDPFDHRSLEFFEEHKGRGDELITLRCLEQRNQEFTGPYQVPSTQIFHDFHELLVSAYGIDGIVRTGTVLSITPTEQDGGPIFEVKTAFGNQENRPNQSTKPKIIRAKRVVCAMGPIFRAKESYWEENLRNELGTNQAFASERILHFHQIIPFLKKMEGKFVAATPYRLLIVGGGITSAQLALAASKSDWCSSVTLIQRSKAVPRHFDVENKWMGRRRGELLAKFWSLDMNDRAKMLRDARGGGSIPPEIIEDLLQCQKKVSMRFDLKEEVEISHVHRDGESLRIFLDDGSECTADLIFLATGADNHIDCYSALSNLREVLPVSAVNGFPVLNDDLSWRAPEEEEKNEPEWISLARKRFWCLGVLAALELGPDALNLVGARHGAVKVAEAIRCDLEVQKKADNSPGQ